MGAAVLGVEGGQGGDETFKFIVNGVRVDGVSVSRITDLDRVAIIGKSIDGG